MNVVYLLMCHTFRVAKIKQIHGKPQQVQQCFHMQGV